MWAYCFLEYAQNAPPFYPDKFRVAADSILNELHTTRKDITFDMAKTLVIKVQPWTYTHWVAYILNYLVRREYGQLECLLHR